MPLPDALTRVEAALKHVEAYNAAHADDFDPVQWFDALDSNGNSIPPARDTTITLTDVRSLCAALREAREDTRRVDWLEQAVAGRGEFIVGYEPPDHGDWSVGIAPSAGGFQFNDDDEAPPTLREALDRAAQQGL